MMQSEKQAENYENIIKRFQDWMAQAERTEPNDPNAICLATVSREGRPSARMVLLKAVDAENHFVFYTNFKSRKARDLLDNPHAALTIHWKTTGKQIRIEGKVEQVTDSEADTYFASRSYGSRIGAWASHQSSPLENRAELEDRYQKFETEFEGKEHIPRPDHWSGFRLIPDRIEFWQDGKYRLHHRELFTPSSEPGIWSKNLLNP